MNLIFPKLDTTYTDKGRFYISPDGDLYPSVTTVLGEYYKDYYLEIAERIGKERFEKLKKAAADRGTRVHDLSEKYIRGEIKTLSDVNPLLVGIFKPIKNFIDENIQEPIAIEETIYSKVLRMAGRFDLLARLKNGSICLIDYKTSNGDKERKDIDSYFFQCTAYCTALRELFELRVNKFIIVITETGCPIAKVFEGNPNDYIHDLIKLRQSVDL